MSEMKRHYFADAAELPAWLAAAGIDTGDWGQGAAKGIDDLWQEYATGETAFRDDPPTRVVDVAQVIIRRGDRELLELAQEFADGRRRTRLQPPTEKLKQGETPVAAAWRCLDEELGLRDGEVALDGTGQLIEEEADSPSYPGLPTRYVFHVFEATAETLPDEDFYRDNAAPDDPIRRHYWGWR